MAALVVLVVAVFLGVALVALAFLIDTADDFALGEGIGVVEVEGIISDGEPIVKALEQFCRSEKVKAIVIRINSPGGGVASSQEIYREIHKAKIEKKVVASLGSVAASGALYIASASDKIMANPGTVTGSIGVIVQLMNFEDVMGKIGVRSVVIKSGPYKDIGSATRPMTKEERAILQDMVDKLHRQFVRDLAKGRGLKKETVAALADGRIFSGEEALDLGLVDKLGNFEDALELAAKSVGLEEDYRVIRPKEDISWWERVLGGKSPVKILPDWINQPLRFQYLYLPSL